MTMVTSSLILAVLLAVVGLSVANYDDSASYVKTFDTKSDFERQVVQGDGVWFVQFCSFGDTACNEWVPAYNEIAKIARGVLGVAAVDTSTSGGKEIASGYSVKKSPTFYTFSTNKENPSKYTGGMDPQSMIQFLLNEIVNVFQGRASPGSSQQKKSSSSRRSNKPVVVEANESNYDEIVLNNPNVVLVAFTAPWCGYCKKLMPEWEEAAQRLEGEGVTIVNVDATENKQLASIYGVTGFPTIKYFEGGKNKSHQAAKSYEYQREAGPIVEFAMQVVDKTGVPKEIDEMVSQEVMEETCSGRNRICVLAALPHILDSGAEGRNKYRDTLAAVQKSFRSGGSFKFLWFEGGIQTEFESVLELTFGFPAIVALSLEREAYTVLRGSFSEKSITSFLGGVTTGRQKSVKLSRPLPKLATVEPWDGEDGAPIEEEMSLDEIMGWGDDDDDDSKKEL